MSNNVNFKFGTKAKHDALEVKDPHTLYFLSDVLELWKGDELYGKGSTATALAAGLMSAADKAKLDALSDTGATGNYVLTAADNTIEIADAEGEGSGKTIKVKVSGDEGNDLQVKADGLYVHVEPVTMLKGSTIGTVTTANSPYDGAEVGDRYIDFEMNDETSSHLYVPLGDLFNPYIAGDGIAVDGSTISVTVDPANANGLSATSTGIALGLATVDKPGAMSAVDKVTLDALAFDMDSVKVSLRNLEDAMTWGEM